MRNDAAELLATLSRLETVVAGKHVRTTLRAGAKVVAAQMLADVPRESGETAAEIKVRASKRSRTKVGMMVTVSRAQADKFYAGFANFGHRVGKRLKGWAKAVAGWQKTANDARPAVPGKHWMEGAWDKSIVAAEDKMFGMLRDLAEAEGEKGGGGAGGGGGVAGGGG